MLRSRIFLVVLALLSLGLFTQRQVVRDRLRLRGYTPPAPIAKLAELMTLTDQGRTLFYVNKPVLTADKNEFGARCLGKKSGTDGTATVLGCYHGNDTGIFLYEVTDPRLNGVIEVTAAHELLHAAYDRMSVEDRRQLQAQMEDAAKDKKTAVFTKLKKYKGANTEEIWDELHSILGTEFTDLPKSLEAHYAAYFKNRAAIAAAFRNYEAEFLSRQTKVENYDKEAAALRSRIESQKADLESRNKELAELQKTMQGLLKAHRERDYNKLVPQFNARAEGFNEALKAANAVIAKHNEIVKARNEIAFEAVELTASIDSSDHEKTREPVGPSH